MKIVLNRYPLFYGVLVLGAFLSGCASKPPGHHVSIPPGFSSLPPTQRPYKVDGHTYYPLPSARGFVQVGYASWYGRRFHGRPTANGERYDMHAFTAAHRTLPMDTWVLVQNLENGRQVVARINDRGPFVKRRIIDLSYAAARRIGLVGPGTAKVRVIALAEGRLSGGQVHFTRYPALKRGTFYVQVGAFRDPANAYALKQRLERTYGRVHVYRCALKGRTFYRVQLFASHDYDDAKALEARMERSGFPGAFVVAR